MARLNVYNIPPHRAFADALVAGICDKHGTDALALARGIVLLPNNRGVQAVRDAFVRRSDYGLMLPRLVPIGDIDLDAQLGALFDPVTADAVPPAINPLTRQLILARLIQQEAQGDRGGQHVFNAAEATRLAADLARTLDQLTVDGISPSALREVNDDPDLSEHWASSLEVLSVILDQWPQELAKRGRVDLAERRNRLLARVAAQWGAKPPFGFVIAAGISTTAPQVAALLRVIARMSRGSVVLAGLDTYMSEDDWAALIPDEAAPPVAVHPQYHLRLLLNRMGVARSEVKSWRATTETAAAAQRSRTLSAAMALPATTAEWSKLTSAQVRLSDIHALECQNQAHEANTIAIALRHALEIQGQTAALVTPDRNLAARVVAQLQRWGIQADDSAGQPVSQTPAGGLILALTSLVASNFAPVDLLSVLKHPLVHNNGSNLEWVEGVRALDLALRGPRPAPGMSGLDHYLAGGNPRERRVRDAAAAWWSRVSLKLALLNQLRASEVTLAEFVSVLRTVADDLVGEAMWSGEAGKALAKLLAELGLNGDDGPVALSAGQMPQIMRQLLEAIAVRPSGAVHPRLSIWGLIEAKLQTADVMILSGLNEGTWPALPATDPWLAPKIRALLRLPTLETRIGLAAHDLVGAMGAKQVLLTRAKRDDTAPTLASRFWLRLEALSGGLTPPPIDFAALALGIDRPIKRAPLVKRPAPTVLARYRPKSIRVNEVDMLKADPFSYYASAILRLRKLDLVDAEPSAAWRGTLVHTALRAWADVDSFAPEALAPRLEAAFKAENIHPLLAALWLPKFKQAAGWIANQTAALRLEGREPLAWEVDGQHELHGVTLRGRLDRLDRDVGGSLVILDYKTGEPHSVKAVEAGHAMQLGLIAIMAEAGAFKGVEGVVEGLEYWSFARRAEGNFGKIRPVVKRGNARALLTVTEEYFRAAVETWLTGEAPFVAKLRPKATYGDYDHLMRYEEWFGKRDDT